MLLAHFVKLAPSFCNANEPLQDGLPVMQQSHMSSPQFVQQVAGATSTILWFLRPIMDMQVKSAPILPRHIRAGIQSWSLVTAEHHSDTAFGSF